MKLQGMGRHEGRYSDEHIVWVYPNNELCKTLAAKCELPEIVADKIVSIACAPKRGPKLKAFWDKMKAGIGEPVVVQREDETICMGDFMVDGVKIHAGFQVKEGDVYAMISGNCRLLWEKTPEVEYGELEREFEVPAKPEDVCVYDLQSGSDTCYYAGEYTNVDGQTKALWLLGNGWFECGYPIMREIGRYAAFVGATAKKLRAELDAGRIPDFDLIWDGTLKDLRIIKILEG